MTLQEIKALVLSVDPAAQHYFTTAKGRDYTYWEETARLGFTADDRHEEGWAFSVHRFTRDEFDPVARRLFAALDADPRTAVRETIDHEMDTGYIHHIFDCEGY